MSFETILPTTITSRSKERGSEFSHSPSKRLGLWEGRIFARREGSLFFFKRILFCVFFFKLPFLRRWPKPGCLRLKVVKGEMNVYPIQCSCVAKALAILRACTCRRGLCASALELHVQIGLEMWFAYSGSGEIFKPRRLPSSEST